MLKKTSLLTTLFVALTISNSFTSNATSQVKAGSKCLKAGQITVVASKKFTCVKSGSKLMWDKGLAILLQPLFTAIPAANNYEWDITVTNYQGRNSLGLDFSYSFSVDGGIWNLFSKTKIPKEKIVVNQSFKLLEIKVAVSDSSNQYSTSPQFQRVFRIPVEPPRSAVTKDSRNSGQNSLPTVVAALAGVQWQNMPSYYIGNTPAARVLFRWPKQLDSNVRGYIIRYESTAMVTPPCDLSKALCEPRKRVDERVLKKVIGDASVESVIVEELSVDTNYEFSFYLVLGGQGSLDSIEIPKTGFKIYLNTPTEGVPAPPEAIIISSIAGNIKISSSVNPPNGSKIAVYVSGGKFGSGSTPAGYLEKAGELLIPASPGLYIVSTLQVSPSGVNGTPSGSVQVTVK
jgi:hypothetical protein